MDTTNNKSIIPIFPLGIVVLPGEHQKLHIFEPRYQQLMKDIRKKGCQFGIPYTGSSDEVHPYGSLVRVNRITSYNPDNGEMDIIVEGERTFRTCDILFMYQDKIYDSAQVVWLDDSKAESCNELLTEFMEYYHMLSRKYQSVKTPEKFNDIWTIAKFLPLTEKEKLHFVKLEDPEKRRRFLTNKVKLLKVINMKTHDLEDRFFFN